MRSRRPRPARNVVGMSDLSDLTRIAQESAQAYFDGDLDTYAGLVRHSDDFSLMPPFGGHVRKALA